MPQSGCETLSYPINLCRLDRERVVVALAKEFAQGASNLMETPMIADTLAMHARFRPHAPALGDIETRQQWSYAALDAHVDQVAAWLVDQLGPASGARVATLARNCTQMVVLHLACARAGAIFVPYNWRLAAAEIAGLMVDAQPAMVFADAEFVVPEAGAALYDISKLAEITGKAPARPPAAARRDIDAPTTLLYTSGTSGTPKGVMVSEANVFWGNSNFALGNGITAEDVFLCDMPLFHTAGMFAVVRVALFAGAMVWISKGFDAAQSVARIADPKLGVTVYFSVPQMAQMIWNHPGFSPDMLKGLKVMATGGAPNPKVQVERFIGAGIAMSDGFGMSETGSNFGMPMGDRALVISKAGSCGLPYVSVEMRIVDEDENDVATGKTGELWLRSPSITAGYWNQPELTAKAFFDGWFKTGDAAMRDADGFTFLVDRKKDMYISGGENVYPAEVEAAITELPEIAEVAVIGVADERWGEVGKAFVIAKTGMTVAPEAVITHCKERLAKFKVPASVVVTDSIPRTASGKVQKHLLKDQ
jgi:fatty-acyl-CoA synthase